MLDTLGNLERTHSCGELRELNVGAQVVLMGWVARKREHPAKSFVDLRDRYGLTQIYFGEDISPEVYAKSKNLRGEFVIAIKGEVVARDEAAKNLKIPTGEIEIKATELLILNDAKTLPFELEKRVRKIWRAKIYV